jgi:ferredoxin
VGDILDDFIQIGKEFGMVKEDFTTMQSQISGKERTVREIWDPARYRAEPSIDYELCTHTAASCSICQMCADICPSKALIINEGNVQISSKDCIRCNLCVAVCPTEALTSSKLDAKKLYDRIAANAAKSEVSYVTCPRGVDKTPPDGVEVLPCGGAVRPEFWFALLTAYPNIGIFLPLDTCEHCSCKRGEELMGAAVERAESWSG